MLLLRMVGGKLVACGSGVMDVVRYWMDLGNGIDEIGSIDAFLLFCERDDDEREDDDRTSFLLQPPPSPLAKILLNPIGRNYSRIKGNKHYCLLLREHCHLFASESLVDLPR